jgi:hypothetical protein
MRPRLAPTPPPPHITPFISFVKPLIGIFIPDLFKKSAPIDLVCRCSAAETHLPGILFRQIGIAE